MPQAIEGTVIPTNTAPTAVCGAGSQPSNEPMLATEAVRPDPRTSGEVRSTMAGAASHSQPPRWDDPLIWVSSEDDPENWHLQGQVDAKVGVQKMHKDTKYVLFLDDDVRLHPGSIRALTREMEKNPEV
ncbi:hypothetical protein RJT34_06910 [Clitoria ternatea]|uniref:Uncharacterized protein n=1 Tax=Clitoria ternatea TaxID=43366 RepID=A0AAN9PTX6_CLITE